jgi:hypothetical protein
MWTGLFAIAWLVVCLPRRRHDELEAAAGLRVGRHHCADRLDHRPLAAPSMTRIVRTAYRYKRPPRRKKAPRTVGALEVPAVVRTQKNGRRRDAAADEETKCPRVSGPGQEDPTPASDDRKPAIVSIRRKPEKILPPGLLPETEEEAKRRADAMWRELARRVAEKA